MAKAKTGRSKADYTKADLKAVSNHPEWSRKDFARAKPFSEVFPELHASIKRSRGAEKPKLMEKP